MRDPDQLFTISAEKRSGIAEQLNDFIDCEIESCESPDCLSPHNPRWSYWKAIPKFEPGDERLTDELCASFAANIGSIDNDLSFDAMDDERIEFVEDLLKQLGYTGPQDTQD